MTPARIELLLNFLESWLTAGYCRRLNISFELSYVNLVYKLGDHTCHSMGSMRFIIPPSGPKTIVVHIVRIAIPILLDLEAIALSRLECIQYAEQLGKFYIQMGHNSNKSKWSHCSALARQKFHIFCPEGAKPYAFPFHAPFHIQAIPLASRSLTTETQGGPLQILTDIWKGFQVWQRYSFQRVTFSSCFLNEAVSTSE